MVSGVKSGRDPLASDASDLITKRLLDKVQDDTTLKSHSVPANHQRSLPSAAEDAAKAAGLASANTPTSWWGKLKFNYWEMLVMFLTVARK